MQHHVFIILVLTECNSSFKCHIQGNMYNTVIYCNNRGMKFHKKRNKTVLPLPMTCIDLPNTSEMSLPNFRLLICWKGIDSVHLALLYPSGCITFPGIMSTLSADVFVSTTLAGKKVLGVCVHVCACVSASLVYASVCQCLWLSCGFCWACECAGFSFCVRPLVHVSVSDRCVGSGLQSCWQCDLALLSLVGRPALRRSHNAGTAPSHGCLSCGGAYTPGPLSEQAYKCETRSVWHSKDPRSSLQISGRHPPLGLKMRGGENKVKICYMEQTSLKTSYCCYLNPTDKTSDF